MNELITDLESYLNKGELQAHQLSELNALVNKISNGALIVSSQEVCEKIISFAETLVSESREKKDLHDVLYRHFPDAYLSVIERIQTQLDLLNNLEVIVEDKKIDLGVRKKLSNFLARLKAQSYPLSVLFREILAWVKDFEKSHTFDMDEDLTWKETINEVLEKFSPEMSFKLAVFNILCAHYPKNNFGSNGYLDKLSPSEFCCAIYMLMEQEECSSTCSRKNKEALLAKVFEMDKEYLDAKSPSTENAHPLLDVDTLVCALNHCLTVTPGFSTMQQNLDLLLTNLAGSNDLQSGDVFKALEAWAGSAQHQTKDENLRAVLREFEFKISLACLVQQKKAECSSYMLNKVRNGLLGEKSVEEGGKYFAVPPHVSHADGQLFLNVKRRCRKYLQPSQNVSLKTESLNIPLRLF